MGTMKTIEDVGAYLIEQSKETIDKCSKASKEYYDMFHITGFVVSDIMPGYLSKNSCTPDAVQENLKNFMVRYSNNMIAALFAEAKSIRLWADLNAANDRIKKEAARKRAAFLFILLNGLEEQFKDFLNKHGIDDEDEVQNAIREFHNN
jgi:hypothetical protein